MAREVVAALEGSSEVQELVRRGYDLIAQEYDLRLSGETALDELFIETEKNFILRGAIPKTRILDMGCGTGRLTMAAAERGALVTGIDLSEGMLGQAREKARARGLTVRFCQGDIVALPFENGEFDCVISTLALMHVAPENRLSVFREAARVLRPGGELAVSVKNLKMEEVFPNRFITVDRIESERKEIVFTKTLFGREHGVPWYSFYPEDLESLLLEADLKLTDLRGNVPIAAWLADQAMENAAVAQTIRGIEAVLGNVPPFNRLGWYLLARATRA